MASIRYLPGDNKNKLDEIIRVDHSGELGAINIYRGQIAATKKGKTELLQVLNDMYQEEMKHFEYFKSQIEEHRIRPSFFTPLWAKLGFIIGYITGLLGEKTAMTLTVGVETVIGNHYKEQIKTIEILEKNGVIQNGQLKEKISQFMQDELEHLDIGINRKAEEMCCHFYFRKVVELATTWAIHIAKDL